MASAANFYPQRLSTMPHPIRRITADIELMADDEADDDILRYHVHRQLTGHSLLLLIVNCDTVTVI